MLKSISELKIGHILRAFDVTMHPILRSYYKTYQKRQKNTNINYNIKLNDFDVWIRYPEYKLSQKQYNIYKYKNINMERHETSDEQILGVKHLTVMKLITDNDQKMTSG